MGEKVGEKMGGKMGEERCEGERETAQVSSSISVVVNVQWLQIRDPWLEGQNLGEGHSTLPFPGEHRRPELVEPGEARVRSDEPGGAQRWLT